MDKYGHYRGIIDAFQSVLREEGILGLYRGTVCGGHLAVACPDCPMAPPAGMSTALVVCVPTLAISYSSYGTLKSFVVERQQPYLYCEQSGQLTAVGGLLCGSVSGMVLMGHLTHVSI